MAAQQASARGTQQALAQLQEGAARQCEQVGVLAPGLRDLQYYVLPGVATTGCITSHHSHSVPCPARWQRPCSMCHTSGDAEW